MSYEYANTLFITPRQASRAAVGDWLYACGNNRTEDVAKMAATPIAELAKEMASTDFVVPYLDEHNATIEQLINEVICDAQARMRDESAAESD